MTLGLPDQIRGCLFDLDGVLTQTAKLHALAWEEAFNWFLKKRNDRPFDRVRDYEQFVDGKPRLDGVRSFLDSRGIHLPEGTESDSTDTETVYGVGNRKNEAFNRLLKEKGVVTFDGSIRYLKAVREKGFKTAVVTSSRNCKQVLEAARITTLFDARIDGGTAHDKHLPGKPAPDTYLAGAHELKLHASECVVFEDALAGVEAGRAGKFGWVVGVDRLDQADALHKHGADIVVEDLSELLERP